MDNVTIIPGEDGALAILVTDDTVELNYSVLSVWFAGTEVQDGERIGLWNWSIVTYIGKTIGSSYSDDDCSPIPVGSYWRQPGDSVKVMNDLLAFLSNAADQPENTDAFPQRVKEWAKRWEDLIDLAISETDRLEA